MHFEPIISHKIFFYFTISTKQTQTNSTKALETQSYEDTKVVSSEECSLCALLIDSEKVFVFFF